MVLYQSFFKGGFIDMGKMIFGYARVSTADQNLDRQISALKEYGVDKIFEEKLSGARSSLPELDKLFEQVRTGDTIVVESLTRLGRKTASLLNLIEKLYSQDIALVSIKENIDFSSPAGRAIIGMQAVFAQLEREVTVERVREGIIEARKRGRKGGRPAHKKSAIDYAIALYKSNNYSISEIIRLTGVSKASLYKYLKQEQHE